MKIAWFSPIPPSRSGIAAYSTEILPRLRQQHEIDVFVDGDPDRADGRLFRAHDFVWKQRRNPYDLTVFQLGNAACHGYMWGYLFNYPGLVVLHDAQLHQARALWLLKRYRPRFDDYFAEFRATEPEAPPDAALLVAAGLGEGLYQHWPFVRLVLHQARLTVVHNARLRNELSERYPSAAIDAITMGVAEPEPRAPRSAILARHGIPSDAVVLAAFGGVTPEKRLGSIIRALAALAGRQPHLHLMLVGEEAEHYDARADAARHGVADRVHITGYVDDAEVASYLSAAEMCACLRWPTNRETSASWLRCLAAGRATLITALAQLSDVPTITISDAGPRATGSSEPIAVSIDVLDEARTLPLALEWLAADAGRRSTLGVNAIAWWTAHHRLEHMAADYDRVITRAVSRPVPTASLPAHLRDDGSMLLRALASQTGVTANLAELLD